MSKENLKILDFEDKLSRAGKRYTRFKTERGWMSAFDAEVIEPLKNMAGKGFVEVEVVSDEEKGFTNIRGFYGYGAANGNKIKESLKAEMKVEEEKVPIKKIIAQNHVTMYTSYAKDIFCELCGYKIIEKGNEKETMQKAVELVKQAREAFS